jgi:magnesium transporter
MKVLTAVDPERIKALLAADTFFWLDVRGPEAEDLQTLAGLLGLHPAAVEDTIEMDQMPRLDDYGDHVLLIFFTAEASGGTARPLEVHVFASGGWIVTARHCPCRLDSVHEWLARSDIANEDELLYHVLDALADGWDPVLDDIDARVDTVEIEVLARPRQGQLETIYRLRQEVSDLLRHAGPQAQLFPGALEVIHALPGLARGSREWLRDVEAHTSSVASDLRRITSDLHALSETFFNANANRLNRLATVITVGSVFFLVWTLVTGFFGQNFKWLTDHIQSRHDFLLYGIGGMIVPTIVLAIIAYVWRRSWW